MNDSASQPGSSTEEAQRRGALVLRTLPILLIPLFVIFITGLLLRLTVGDVFEAQQSAERRSGFGPLIPIVVLVIFFSALIMLVRLGRPTISALALISVWTLLTTLVSIRFGITTYFPALLIVPICVAGLLIDGVASVSLAAMATLLVGSIAWLEVRGAGPPPPAPTLDTTVTAFLSVGYWAAIFWTIAALTWLLAGSLHRTLQQSRAQARQLQELSAGLEARVLAQTAELVQRTARAEALYEVGRALTSTSDMPQALGVIAEHAARLLRFDAATVLHRQPGDDIFTEVAAYNCSQGAPLPLHEYDLMLRGVLEDRRPRVLEPTQPGAQTRIGALVLPMIYGEMAAGVLVLIGGTGHAERGADDLALAEGLASQAAVAIANAQLMARLRETATLEERTRLAREIHDTLAQGLTGIVVQLGAAQRALDAAPDEADEHLDLAQRMAREALAEARRSVWNLRAPALERGDLADALRGLVEHPAQSEVAGTFEQRGQSWELSPDVESALLRVTQEALVNVAKHAEATHVVVVLEYAEGFLRLWIQDDGIGFDERVLPLSPPVPSPWSGFGLLGMRERITALGGSLELTSDGGARVVATVPRAAARMEAVAWPASLQPQIGSLLKGRSS